MISTDFPLVLLLILRTQNLRFNAHSGELELHQSHQEPRLIISPLLLLLTEDPDFVDHVISQRRVERLEKARKLAGSTGQQWCTLSGQAEGRAWLAVLNE